MMDFHIIDHYANNIESPVHSINSKSKILILFLTIITIIFAKNIDMFFLLIPVLWGLIFLSKLSLKRIILWSFIPLFFATLFAISILISGYLESSTIFLWDLKLSVLIMLKAWTAALSMILFTATTPSSEIFFFFDKFLPKSFNELLIISYRSIFILSDELEHILVAQKIKGTINPKKIIKNPSLYANILGTMIIKVVDRTERLHEIMKMRGYYRSIVVFKGQKMEIKDYAFILIGVLFLILIVFIEGVKITGLW